jgi:hypothetical protein
MTLATISREKEEQGEEGTDFAEHFQEVFQGATQTYFINSNNSRISKYNNKINSLLSKTSNSNILFNILVQSLISISVSAIKRKADSQRIVWQKELLEINICISHLKCITLINNKDKDNFSRINSNCIISLKMEKRCKKKILTAIISMKMKNNSNYQILAKTESKTTTKRRQRRKLRRSEG